MPFPAPGIDLGGPAEVCVCGSELWNVKCVFQDGELTTMMMDMSCAICGALARLPLETGGEEEGYVTV